MWQRPQVRCEGCPQPEQGVPSRAVHHAWAHTQNKRCNPTSGSGVMPARCSRASSSSSRPARQDQRAVMNSRVTAIPPNTLCSGKHPRHIHKPPVPQPLTHSACSR